MKLCKYAFYDEKEKLIPRLYCKVGGSCIYSKRCHKVERYIHIDDFDPSECYKYVDEERKHIPEGSYFVQLTRKNKKGKLLVYVVIDDNVEKISTDYDEINQNYVYVKKTQDGYKISLTPFKKAYKKVKDEQEKND